MSIAVLDLGILIRIEGRADCSCGAGLKKIFQNTVADGTRCFFLDLRKCNIMDSTFLGVLAGVCLKTKKMTGYGGPLTIELHHPTEIIKELLDNLGVLKLFNIIQNSPLIQVDTGELELTEKPTDAVDLVETSLEAHKTLMEYDSQNIPKFKAVAQFLEEDLKRKSA